MIGILPGNRISYIDHLVPLCQIMGIPILVTDKWIKTLIELYYPPMEILYREPDNYCFEEELSPYHAFFYVDHYRLPHQGFQFAEYFSSHKRRSVYSLHGNSDKNRNTYWIEGLADEDVVLLYGPQMIDFLKEKGVDKRIEHLIVCGNYRLQFYRKHQSFFDAKIRLPKKEKTILYAPTWTSTNLKSQRRFDYSSFFDVAHWVMESVPENYQLIVKLHPHLVFLLPEAVEKIKEQYPHIYFLDDFPLIYPLLRHVDIYLGDNSSIGYDFLYFKRPMFFLNHCRSTFLSQCGLTLEEKDFPKLYEKLQEDRAVSGVQQDVYAYAFGKDKPLDILKQEIEEAVVAH
ncbi:MAG: CDP-glycerol glycerophosphotransferase family protein [Chlamydiales bacterium]